MATRLLVVEDDRGIATLLKHNLTIDGFDVRLTVGAFLGDGSDRAVKQRHQPPTLVEHTHELFVESDLERGSAHDRRGRRDLGQCD